MSAPSTPNIPGIEAPLARRGFTRWLRATTLVAIASLPVVAYTYDLPGGPFQAGTAISADAVNGKFDALLSAVSELDETRAQLGSDADFGDVSVASLTVTEPTTKTLTYWTDRAFRCSHGNCDGTASQCWAQINGRPGCIVGALTAPTRVTIPIDHVPDGVITEWGMHVGWSNQDTANNWTCELRYVEQVMSTLSFSVNGVNHWNEFVNTTGLDVAVDNHALGSSRGTGFTQGWSVRCVSSGTQGRLDFHQIYIRSRQETL